MASSFMGKNGTTTSQVSRFGVSAYASSSQVDTCSHSAGTRTQHRMAVNIEDAGFEIRDMIAWVYSSGFPKSLDVSKAIDKMAGAKRELILDEDGNQVWTSQKQGKNLCSMAEERSCHFILPLILPPMPPASGKDRTASSLPWSPSPSPASRSSVRSRRMCRRMGQGDECGWGRVGREQKDVSGWSDRFRSFRKIVQ